MTPHGPTDSDQQGNTAQPVITDDSPRTPKYLDQAPSAPKKKWALRTSLGTSRADLKPAFEIAYCEAPDHPPNQSPTDEHTPAAALATAIAVGVFLLAQLTGHTLKWLFHVQGQQNA